MCEQADCGHEELKALIDDMCDEATLFGQAMLVRSGASPKVADLDSFQLGVRIAVQGMVTGAIGPDRPRR